ncbi:MAG: HNH endonuclease [Planctomycetales bacterium]|nr:HNH endonuclease [Planctomycetales bacterium]
MRLIKVGLLPNNESTFHELLNRTDPWELRRQGLSEELEPHEFGRVLLHLAQRRGASGFTANVGDEGKVKNAIVDLHFAMLRRYGSDEVQTNEEHLRARIEKLSKKKRRDEVEELELDGAHAQLKELCSDLLQQPTVTYGRFIADLRDEWRTPITTPDRRKKKKGPREWRKPVRNRDDNFQFHADRSVIRDEFHKLWRAQKHFDGPLSLLLTDELLQDFDDESRDSNWRHKGLIFGQRMQTWDVGTLGRCTLEPTDRCVPHADMYASRYLVIEFVNNLKVKERGLAERPITPDERSKIIEYLTGPLGVEPSGKKKGLKKTSVTWTDLRKVLGWGRATKTTQYRFNYELKDAERTPTTDWFSREIVHGAISQDRWETMSNSVREGINRAILSHDPDELLHHEKLKVLVMKDWCGLSERQADAFVAAWKKRPRLDAKQLSMSRRAVRNLLTVMDREEPWRDEKRPGHIRWLTQIEARKKIAHDDSFIDVTTGKPLDESTKRRYLTGTKGSTARDRYYMRKHLLKKKGQIVYDPEGSPLHELPPAPMIRNPVVRKSIHEVRRHIIEFLATMGRKPDEIRIELAREAKLGKKDSDRLLDKNRLRNRIRKDIIDEFDLDGYSSNQQRAAVQRVILAVQQGEVCALCGNQHVTTSITPRVAAEGTGVEVAHIIPRASGGHNGLSNIVLAHDKCNQEMGRRTPREYWNVALKGGFAEGITWIEQIYRDIERAKPADAKKIKGGNALWACYFNGRDDASKIEQFKKDIKDIREMTPSQLAATTYASRAVMAYLSDALFDGKGLPERSPGGDESEGRTIFATDGTWTGRLRREWGLFFDPHNFRSHGLTNDEERKRKEKDRGDHRHHAIDAIVTAVCTEKLKNAWLERERQADRDGVNTADHEQMERYRRDHTLPVPSPFKSVEDFRKAVQKAVYGDGSKERPVSHRPVKRKLVGFLHKPNPQGVVIDYWKQAGKKNAHRIDGRTTKRQSILGSQQSDFLKSSHLRLPTPENETQSINRLARRYRIGNRQLSQQEAKKLARKRVKDNGFVGMHIDPKPDKGGIVRDVGLRRLLRRQLEKRGLDPDNYTQSELKASISEHGPLTHESGVPIKSVVLLWSNRDPVEIQRTRYEYASEEFLKDENENTLLLYDGQNNHHIEIRVGQNKKGAEVWSGRVVSAFQVSKQLIQRLRKLRELERPFRHLRKKLSRKDHAGLTKDQRKELSQQRKREWKGAMRELRPQRSAIIKSHPLVDRSDDKTSGKFVMSLCEGDTLYMRHKNRPDEVNYFVVAKLDKPQKVWLVPHWDARAATGRKDENERKVPDSMRELFSIIPQDLKDLAPPGFPLARKARVSPLGQVQFVND